MTAFVSRYGAPSSWFPGHMATTTHTLARVLRDCDVVVEVRDARIPVTSGNPILTGLCASMKRPRVVVFNKADLIPVDAARRFQHLLAASHVCSVFSDASGGRRQFPAHARRILDAIDSIAPPAKFKTVGTTALVLGMPNVGKSSVINCLSALSSRTKHVARARVGAEPGITRHVSVITVRAEPRLNVFDTPGVLLPRLDNHEHALKLALCETLPDKAVKWAALAEYLLYSLRRSGASAALRDALQLPRTYTEDGVEDMLRDVAARTRATLASGAPDFEAAARHVVRAFRDGHLGRHVLDDDVAG